MTETVMSWWVGKDRESFGRELKVHTDRIMREGVKRPERAKKSMLVADVEVLDGDESDLAPEPERTPAPVSPAPSLPSGASRHAERRRRYVAQGLCPCGKARTSYAYRCDRCQEAVQGANRQSNGFQPWRPGSQGRVPKAMRPLLAAAAELRAAIEEDEEAQRDPKLAQAAIVMLCGFLLRQREDWIAAWTKSPAADVARIVVNLRQSGIWQDGRLHCEWMEIYTAPRATKKQLSTAYVAFWLDAAVAAGQFTRESRNGEFFYGLREWERA